MDDDARWLDAAAALAIRGRPFAAPNPSVGCIIQKDGIVLGRGWTQAGGRPHAEAMALEAAGSAVAGATAYVSLEPCAHKSQRGPACADLLVTSGLSRVAIGCHDPDPRTNGKGIARLREAGITVDLVTHAKSVSSLSGFLTREEKQRPHVTLKLAVSSDGFIGPLSGEAVTITGDIARAHVHRHRALAEGIVVGGATYRGDVPRLDVRLPGLENRSPRKFLLSRSPAPEGWSHLSAPEAICDLLPMQYLYVEGGGATAAAFLNAGLVDQIMIYCAGMSLGEGIPAYGELGAAEGGAPPPGFTCVDQRAIGGDMLFIHEPN